MDRGTRSLALLALLAMVVLPACLAGGPFAGAEAANSPPVETLSACSGNETTPGVGSPGALPASAGGFELTANRSVVERGEPIAFELTNVADDRRTTDTRNRYALQRRAGGAWKTVTLFPEERAGFNATALVHDPGQGLAWSFRASAGGFSTGKFVVCEPLPAGDYRFVFEGPPALAVRFELVGGSDGTRTVSEHAR
ncbi:hypothetical protein I7X12_04915 [Halosimplex litoreum]|uniref:Uncharacterized protein n=1 Tax=Halosimplex litoreum TaxID=1198301 RepID=A0A7T3G0C6_9EURY|nr:hypothetical protein [Halosimplex litoreum]QPV63976.1 hypothetical protein I7X12_04915 [Halosimplex litoreum]